MKVRGVCVCVCVCARASVFVSVFVSVIMYAIIFVCACLCMYLCVCVARVYVCIVHGRTQTRQVFRWILLARTLLHTERAPSAIFGAGAPIAGLRAVFRMWAGT